MSSGLKRGNCLEKFSYLNRPNLEYIEGLFQQFQQQPDTLSEEWKMFFAGMEFANNQSIPNKGASFSSDELNVYNLIETYRTYGHLKANLDPLQFKTNSHKNFFELKNFHLNESHLQERFQVGKVLGLPEATLAEIIQFLEKSYCQTLTAQLGECRLEVRDWFRKELEQNQSQLQLSAEDRKEILQQLTRTECLEKFIHTRYVGAKRFSIEGGDALIPMLEAVVKYGPPIDVEEIVIGMAHRGRINVLANFMNKALEIIFTEFDGLNRNDFGYDGDVKYHLGYSTDKLTNRGPCHVSLAFNPSHLEAVNPVVLGMTRAKQRRRKDTVQRKKVLPILIHGDAAFAGQGVVSETLQLSQLPGYRVGGTLHLIINNQIGFTTDPKDSRTSIYSSDVSKTIKAPILLVNGDDVEACVRAMEMALRFRQEFGEDIVIDIICYRRFGHNEGDEPAFTQPLMYEKIKNHPTLMKIYSEKLNQEGVLPLAEAEKFYQEKMNNLQSLLEQTRKKPPVIKPNAFEGAWKGLRRGLLEDFNDKALTKVSSDVVAKVGHLLTSEPSDFNLHPKIAKLIHSRHEMIASGKIDWALGELLAYGTLCAEGTPVRLSGQDCKRGTFTHRQSVYFDTKSGKEYCPIAMLNPDQGEFVVYNSSLSEMAVLGFEYGNSCSDPTYLTVWEAQFGDFANGAQIIIDQFVSSGEEKWVRGSGLTMLLPHGYEGGGPEHSSARLERFLQLCAQANMQVVNITTPANFFHVLRRQVRRDFRKPLVVMSPKSLLRHPQVISDIKELSEGFFQEVLFDPSQYQTKKIETLVLCSGKLFYDLEKMRGEKYQNLDHIALVRVEQLYPFPLTQLNPIVNGLPKLKKIIWAQEEPQNMGAWTYIQPHLLDLIAVLGRKINLEYKGRALKASPAVGSSKIHDKEQSDLVESCFS
ncbi:MAG: 2-oxoglutarate dehydrogenase E1 component [Bdellovibrionales bacterium]|nr:2-oxoglutarate dehydrogenase E1 component [Bdellovibrionales bacterium]